VVVKYQLKDCDLFTDEDTVFRRLLDDDTISCTRASRGLQKFLKHDVTHLSGDHLLERLIFLSDTGWLNEETHKFYVEEKAVFKIQVKGEFAELNEICGKKSRKWSKDFSRELQSSLDYFENFLRSKLHHLSDYSEINFHIAISLLFEIANNKKNNLSFSRQSVVRAINVALKSKKEEDVSDLIKLFNGDQEAKTSSFMLMMW